MDMDDSMDMDVDVSMDTTNNGHRHYNSDEDDNDNDNDNTNNIHDNDETDNDDNDDDDDNSQIQVVMERPRGKVLRLPTRDDDSSGDDDDDDDDIQVAAVVGDDNGENEDFSIAETSYAEEASMSFATPMKDNDGDDKEVAVAEVVMDGNESENSEAAPVVAEVVKKVRKKPGPKPKNRDGTKKGSDKRKGSGDKRRKRPESGSKGEGHARESTISRDKLEAAQKARDILLTSIKGTPFHITDSHIIQNFGRVVVEKDSSKEPVFSNATSLFPVGFCCDRYEFSPVHGREIKLRCEILDKKELIANIKEEEPKANGDEKKSKSKSKKGPLFRITWGQGVDELQDGKPFPFDLYSASSPLGGEVDTVAVPMGLDVAVVPEPGMRVKVKFDDDVWYHGTIKKVSKKEASKKVEEKKKGTRSASKKGKKSHHAISIIYDDGMKEEIAFPDPDVMLVAPGKLLFCTTCIEYLQNN